MSRLLLFIVVAFCSISNIAAQRLKLVEEKKDGVIKLYAENEEPYPVSVRLSLTLVNTVFSEGERTLFLVPENAEHFLIGTLTTLPNRSFRYSYRSKYVMGDVNATPDQNYIYELPFQAGISFRLTQGYNGKLTHRNENSLDFTMPEGTDVLAARSGKVVEVVQNNNTSCTDIECKKYNNFVIVMHDDGSFATYVHIRHNGARVRVGDVVKPGQPIAYSGKVGYASGPHLHFTCFLAGFDGRKTLETKFKIDGDKVGYLVEGDSYKRDY